MDLQEDRLIVQMKIFITFDYELFLGREPGSVENCLLRPTQLLVSSAEKFGSDIKFVFFVDTLYLLKLRELSKKTRRLEYDLERITDQLKSLIEKGHDIQLHLHPQWFYSEYDFVLEKWQLDFKHYKLEDCPLSDVETMVHDSVTLLESIAGYKPSAFRAGGYSFPKKPEFLDVFKRYGISEDSSVYMGKIAAGRYQRFDYSAVKEYRSYRFSQSITQEDSGGFFREFPISVIQINPLSYYSFLITERRKHGDKLKLWGDGLAVGTTLPRWKRNVDRLLKLFRPVHMPASVDGINVLWLNEIYEEASRKQSDVMVMIGHPKYLTDYALNGLEQFLPQVQKDCVTFRRNSINNALK